MAALASGQGDHVKGRHSGSENPQGFREDHPNGINKLRFLLLEG